jgi:hypothetical protein
LDIWTWLLLLLSLLVAIPISLVTIFPLYIWRLVVRLLAKVFKAELGSMLSSLDLIFIPPDTSSKIPEQTMTIVLELEGQLDPELFKTRLENEIINVKNDEGEVKYDRLQQHLTFWLGFAFLAWDKNFEIDQHVETVIEVVMDENRDAFVHSCFEAPYEPELSLWNIIIVPRYNGKYRTLLVLRVGHIVGDGVSILKLINTSILSTNPGSQTINPDPTKIKCMEKKKVPISERLGHLYMNTLGVPRQYFKHLRRQAEMDYEPRHGSTSSNWVSSISQIPLERIKGIKGRLGVGYSEAVTAALIGAVSKHMYKYGAKDFKGMLGSFIYPTPNHPDNRLVNDL